jgi:chemotaxis protein methyltransferase CheR
MMTTLEMLNIEEKELKSFLQDVWNIYKVDFREYGKAHLKRRIRHRMTIAKYQSFEGLKNDVLSSKAAFDGLFGDFSINVTELFRDPAFYVELATVLKERNFQYPLKIWITACASGEEVYSFLMLLDHLKIPVEKIVATDFNPHIVEVASQGIIDAFKIKEYLKNLKKCNLEIDFDNYFDLDNGNYQMKEEYLSTVQFVNHNLNDAHDFGTFHMISCRNVLIYFEKPFQNRVINMFAKSLKQEGILCLGSKESLRFMDAYPKFHTISQEHKIYQKN